MTAEINDNDSTGSPPGTPTGWIGWKERGKQAYLRGDFGVALQAYSQALHHQQRSSASLGGPSVLDQQLLLSNMVACRLKLGGAAQAEAAVANAKTCIGLNDRWAKGHVRLASAYIALRNCSESDGVGSSYSNDACNSLQRALQLDPGNPTARDMLVRELRSRDHGRRGSGDNHGQCSQERTPQPSAPPQHMDDNYSSSRGTTRTTGDSSSNTNHRNPGDRRPPQDSRSSSNGNGNRNRHNADNDIDDAGSMSWNERFHFQCQRATFWYLSQSEDVQSLLKVALAVVVLYVAFGGRFGLEYLFQKSSGNNNINRRGGGGDVYEEFYRSRNNDRYNDHYNDRDSYGDRYSSYYGSSGGGYDRHGYGSSSSPWSSWWRSGRGTGSSSSVSPEWNYYSRTLLAVVLTYVAQRWFGIGPYQAMVLVNLLLGRRRGGGMHHFPGGRRGGWGGMFGGNQFRHRPGGMWR